MMGTVVTFQVVGHDTHAEEQVARAVAWFASIEQCCSRFEPESELRQLSNKIGMPVPVSAMLFEAVRFALAIAEDSDGAFDPTVGVRMESLGFDRNHRTGISASSGVTSGDPVTWRDVHLDANERTVTLARPMVLDLGAVAKGLAVDVAARELAPSQNFAIDAGGDLYLGGHNGDGEPWSVGIRHPRDGSLIETLRVSNVAVCTSGDYERRSATNDDVHHIVDGRSGNSAPDLASVTVVAPSAMVADAFSTAAFALGPVDGLRFLERHGLQGLLVTPTLERIETAVAAR